MDHLGVLYAHEESENAQYTGGHPKIEANAVSMPSPCSGSGANDHFVAWQVLCQRIYQRENGCSSAINETLATDLDDVRLRQYLNGRLRVERSHLRLVGETAADY